MVKRKKVNFFRLLFVLILLLFVVEVVKQEVKIYQLNKEIANTQSRLEALAREQDALSKEQARVNDPAFIEKVAREEYNMVKKMEIPVRVRE